MTAIWQLEGVALNADSDMVDDSLGYMVEALFTQKSSRIYVYPTGVAGSGPITSAGGAWGGLGNFATVVGANQIATDYHVVSVSVENISANGVYELVLYYGAGDTEFARLRFASVGGFWGNAYYRIVSPHIPANSQIRAKCEDSEGAGALTISVGYVLHA